jgi:hypothetical protein
MINKTALAIVATLVVLAPRAADARPGNGNSNCNHEFMYYHNGKCLDARNKPDDSWAAPSFNGGSMRMKKSNPCDGLDLGLCDKHGD